MNQSGLCLFCVRLIHARSNGHKTDTYSTHFAHETDTNLYGKIGVWKFKGKVTAVFKWTHLGHKSDTFYKQWILKLILYGHKTDTSDSGFQDRDWKQFEEYVLTIGHIKYTKRTQLFSSD